MKPLACIFLIILISFSSLPVFAYTEEECVACHATDRGESQKKIDLASFKASVHPQSNLSCQDCHTRVLDKTHETAQGQDPVDCSQCHPRESGPIDALSFLASMKISTHEKQDFSLACQKDNCIGCHQGQAIHGKGEPTGNQNCRVCHFDPDGSSALLAIIHLGTGSDKKPVLALLDIIFIIAALITLWIGISRLRTLRASQRKETLRGDFAGLIRYLAGHKKIMGKPITGTLHFIIFWGCLFFILMIIPAQLGLIFPKPIANGISLVMDITGFLMLAAILHFLLNLFHTGKAKRVPGKFLLLFLLLIIVLTGFFSAGSRLKIIQAGFSMVSPIGFLFSVVSPDSPLFMQAMIRLHFSGVLIFFALIPFSFFRHIPAGLRNVYSKQGLNPGELSPVDWDASPLGAKTIFDLSSKPLLGAQACVSCRRCEDQCPATISHKPLNPRLIMASLFHRMTQDTAFFNRQRPARDLEQDISGDEIWACTTCTACATHCPMMINPMDIIMALRRHQVLDKGSVPHEARHSIRNLELFGDPFGKGVSYRTDWRIGLNIPSVRELPEKPEILLWVGCSGAFHPRYGNVARDMARILETAGISFAIPG
ncbi:MAG: 4Fe-4S dicluster domain-containing protein, partial [Desulfobacula sp.]